MFPMLPPDSRRKLGNDGCSARQKDTGQEASACGVSLLGILQRKPGKTINEGKAKVPRSDARSCCPRFAFMTTLAGLVYLKLSLSFCAFLFSCRGDNGEYLTEAHIPSTHHPHRQGPSLLHTSSPQEPRRITELERADRLKNARTCTPAHTKTNLAV